MEFCGPCFRVLISSLVFFQILYPLGHPLGSESVKKCGILRAMFEGSNCKSSVFLRFCINWGTLSVPRGWKNEEFWGPGLRVLIARLVFFQILYRLGHPLGSERVKKCGILRAMFLGSDFKYFSEFVSTGAPSRFREGKKMWNFVGHVSRFWFQV